MRFRVTSLAVVCLLFISLSAAAQPDILSAVPGDAYGFVATKSLQGSYDKIMAFAEAMGLPPLADNKLLAIQEHVGDVDLDGPAVIILLDPQQFSSQPVALLLSAADAQGVLDNYISEAEGSDIELPPGVVKGDDGYLAVKNGFVVFTPKPEQAAAVLASQTSLETMPEVEAAFEKGQIVLAGDLQRAAPWIIQMLGIAQAQMIAQMDQGPAAAAMPQMDMAKEMFSLYLELAQDLLEQTDKLAVALDINAEHAILTKKVLFKADSPAAAFMNAQAGQPTPAYNALPGGPFLIAGGVNMASEGLQSLAKSVLDKFMNLPSIKGKLPEEQAQQYLADLKAGMAQLLGCSFTFNLGNPMAGMFNIVARYDVSDSASYRKLMEKTSSGEGASMWAKASGMPVEYVYTSAAETYSDVEIDTIKMQITPPAEGAQADPKMAQQMQMMAMMYGPDMTFRMAAPTDKQMLFTMGGGSELMERAINVAQGKGSVLAEESAIKQGAANLPANRFAEAYLDLSQVMPMIMMLTMGGQSGSMPSAATATPPVSFSCSAEANTFRADMVLPSATVKSLVEAIGPMIMSPGMAPGGGEPPDEEF
ncbi:MAG: hypothetical protein GWP14_05310 [Actinobacteria bacterium]|nr:hypothetical protein [Actinomycetota bacterium]